MQLVITYQITRAGTAKETHLNSEPIHPPLANKTLLT